MVTTKHLTVMFIDLVEYTHKTTTLKREEFVELHDTFDNLIKPVLKQFSGEIIKKIGDAFLVTFESPTNAVLGGVKLQEKFDEYNEQNQKEPLQIRVAIDSGEVLIRDNDIYGDPVNIAARVEAMTEPGQVNFTQSVFQSMNKNEIPIIDLGSHELRGIPHPIQIYRVKWHSDTFEHYKTVALEIVIGLIILILAIYFFKLLFSNKTLIAKLLTNFKNLF